MRKAQVRMFETIGALFVFFILLTFGLIFYSRMQQASAYSKLDELRQLRIIELAERIKNLPELGCTSNTVLQQDCFDLIKVEKIQKIITENHDYYFDLIDYGSVSVEEIYPETHSYSIYKRQRRQEEESEWVGRTIFMPIALYDAPEKLTYFGVLKVTSYE